MDAPMTVAAALRAAAQEAGTRTALVQGDRRRSFTELDDRAERLAGALAAHGVVPGSTVAIALYNSPEYVETVLAAVKAGARPANINYRYRVPELRHALQHIKASAVVHDASLTGRVREAAADVPTLRVLVEAGEPGPDESRTAAVPTLAFERTASEWPAPDGDLAAASPHGILLLTGGTTGLPKGVIWGRDGLLGILTSIFAQNGLPVPTTPQDVRARVRDLAARAAAPVVLPLSPLMHGTGFFNAMKTLLGGGSICFTTSRSLDVGEVWQLVQQHAVTDMVIVGDAFGRPLIDALALAQRHGRPYDISSVRRITSSGVLWSVEVKRELLRHGHDLTLVDNISASEGGPFGLSEARSEADLADGRFTLPPVARVIDERGQDVRPGSGDVGVLASRGPLPVGYLDDPERTARVWPTIDGVRHAVPGDLASLDADGKLVLLGRGDSVINTGGEKVFPEEVEHALLSHPKVEDAVVVGIPDPRWGQTVAALVAPAGNLADVPDDELAGHVGERLAGYKRPRRIERVAAIPRSPAGKADRPAIKRQIMEAARPPATQETTIQEATP